MARTRLACHTSLCGVSSTDQLLSVTVIVAVSVRLLPQLPVVTDEGTRLDSLADSDIEHVVALSAAHDSGLCAASLAERARFARDLLDNFALATPRLNRHEKVARDAADWLPETQPLLVRRHHRRRSAGRSTA